MLRSQQIKALIINAICIKNTDMRITAFFKVLLLALCLTLGLDAAAQLVDRATFEAHRAKARSMTTQRAATSSPITLTQNPFEIDEFIIETGNITKQVNVYFSTAVMASYRAESCPRVSEFDLQLPTGYSVTAVSRGAALQDPISVYGYFEQGQNTLQFLAYGVCSAAELAQLPTGRIHYATLTIAATDATIGNYSMDMSNACFAMADEPKDFIIDGTSAFGFTVRQLATGISLNKTSATINNGETLQLTATVSPSNTTNKTVTWTSSNNSVATVSNNGLVTAKSAGSATITATTADGSNKSASCNLTVNQLATGVTLNQTSATINNGETLQLTATVSPSNTTNKTVTWTSSNNSVATVSSNGFVTAKSAGTATITATTADGSNLSASCQITVNQLVTSITLSKSSATIVVDRTLQLTYTVTPSNATNKAVTWTSSDPAVATVSTGGLVTTKSVGTTTITATTVDGSDLSASCQVTVTPQLATGVTLSQTTANMLIENTLQLTATVSPDNTTDKTVTWSSSNTAVVTVSSTGLVTAKSVGNATITVTTADGSNKSATCQVTVNPRLVTGITLNKTTATLNNGETVQLTATVTPGNATNPAVTWTSSNISVATVSGSGLVTAKGRGTATITATTTDGTNLSATCEITVNQLATSISLSQTTASIVVDKTLQLTATVSPSNANNKTVAWTSSNTAIATVDNTGLVTAKSVGSATITATTTDGTNLSATCQVTVTPQLATGISLNQSSAEISVGESITLVATVSPSNTTNPAVKWTTENAAVATVERGVVRGVGEGECYITATTQDGTNLSAQCLVAVSGSVDVKVTNVTLSETNVTLTEGSSTVITATVLPENATNKTLAWTSSNTAVATINANGVLQAVAAGTATITATTTDGSNISATCNVTVNSSTVNVPNYLSVGDLPEMVAGQAFVIPIALTNTDPITAIQADLYLPSGIEPNYNDDDQFVWLDEDRKGRGHVVSATVSAVATRIMVSSSRNAAFQGNEGTVLYISLKVNPEQVTGVYGIDLKNIILSSTSGEMFEAPNVKINVGVAAYHSGDANGDGYIDDTDYVITANYILAQNPSNFVFSAADMSGDGRVYVNDLPLIIDAAMNFDFDSMSFAPQRAPKRASSTDALYVNDFDLAGGATKTVSIMLDNTTAFSAVQCDIALPNGLTIVEQTDEWGDPAYALLASARSDDHDAWSDIASTGDVRVIITNSISRRLKGNSGAVATFIVQSANGFSGEHELLLKNIVCADANAVRYALPDAVCLVNHAASIAGDVDGNGAVNGTDLNILINIILGKDNADNYGGRANVNGEGGVDGNDLNKLINIILGK